MMIEQYTSALQNYPLLFIIQNVMSRFEDVRIDRILLRHEFLIRKKMNRMQISCGHVYVLFTL